MKTASAVVICRCSARRWARATAHGSKRTFNAVAQRISETGLYGQGSTTLRKDNMRSPAYAWPTAPASAAGFIYRPAPRLMVV